MLRFEIHTHTDTSNTRLLDSINRVEDLIDSFAEIINEYREVLTRKKFPFDPELIETVIRTIIADGLCMERTKVTDEVFPDPKDIVFYEVAMSAEDSFLVTGNLKHFPKKPFVVSPAEMMEIIHAAMFGGVKILSEMRAMYGRGVYGNW